MGHVEDRWTRPTPTGRRVRADRYGRGKRCEYRAGQLSCWTVVTG